MMRIPNPPKRPQCCCCHIKIGMLIFGVYWIISSLVWAGFLIYFMVSLKSAEESVKIHGNNTDEFDDFVNDAMDSGVAAAEVVPGLYLAFIVACIVSAGLLMYGVTQNKGGYMILCLVLQGVDVTIWALWLFCSFLAWTVVPLKLGIEWAVASGIAAVSFKAFLMYMSVRCYNHIKRVDGVVVGRPYNGPQIQYGPVVVVEPIPQSPYNGDCEMLVPRSYN